MIDMRIDTRHYIIGVEVDSDLVKIRKALTGKRTAPRNGFRNQRKMTKKILVGLKFPRNGFKS